MPDVALYNPPVAYRTRTFFGQLPSLSLATIAALLNRAGISAACYDLEAMRVNPEAIRKMPQPGVIGFTCNSAAAESVQECIEVLRRSGYRGRIVVGGVHATIAPEEVLAWGADLVVTGECDGNVAALILAGADGIQAGEPCPIDDVPMPDWEHYTPNVLTYPGQYEILHPRAGVSMWTRGCPYSCIYCSDIIFNHQPKRYRKPAAIAAEMAALKARGFTNVYAYDDEIIGSKAPEGWMHELADLLEPLNMRWIAQARCSEKYVTAEVLADAYRAGCRLLLWGVESFSQNVLDAVKKHNTPASIWHSLKLAKEAGIKNSVFTMLGNYRETEADARITADGLQKAYKAGLIDYRQTFVCQTMEGTEQERIAKREGWYIPPRQNGAFMKHANGDTPWMTAAAIKHYRAEFDRVCPVPQP